MSVSQTESVLRFGVPPLDPSQLPEIEGNFWTSTPELALIAVEAEKLKVSPWNLLGAILANTASQVPFHVELPDKRGDAPASCGDGGSLNLGVLAVGESGEGKSETMKVAGRLQPPHENIITKGTSSGWIKNYVVKEKVEKETVRVRKAYTWLAQLGEFGGLAREFDRSGSQTSSSLREMLMGERTGNSTSDGTRDNWLHPGSYRFCIYACAQAEILGPLFTDEEIAAGTPQRMLYLPAAWDGPRAGVVTVAASRLPALPTFPGGIGTVAVSGSPVVMGGKINTLAEDETLPAPYALTWSPQCQTDIKAADAAKVVGGYFPTLKMTTRAEVEAHRAVVVMRHARLLRVKVAQMLAFVHGRRDMNDLDWELSEVVIRVHTGILAGVWEVLRQVRTWESMDKGEQVGIIQGAAQKARDEQTDKDMRRISGRVWGYVHAHGKAGKGSMTLAHVKSKLAGPERHLLDAAIDFLQELHDSRSGCGVDVQGFRNKRLLAATFNGKYMYKPSHISDAEWADNS
ncbi:hypothetical protein I3U40_18225 [Mycobacteroides abscessus subsp. abscessus]|uniref:hypothetical protein n=1 Tax=Mycobacteroides abscessus TaxID=36809 RepID=UPI0009A8338F|nr:hypothetical protein [Mycobacteroides abscessus]QSM92994.1 hypothetical protein I3U31_18215 [Mycobacteroides abscessus subsp. abscessus]QSM98032.1 hypothetical protein I3U40_18225 [Mycobacteroides abscessus subsp. abscessus]SLI40891.1 bifunctional DNA primase/polymerase domain protein [Mycobacteroides abscessus subsp. abscessus]